MRRHAVHWSFAVALLSQNLFASAKTDSIVAFLGGAHAKFVWPRWAWCNENYTPKPEATAKAEGKSLMLLDTRTGTERALLTGVKIGGPIRISRSGKWVTFRDGSVKKTYIVDLTATSPQQKVLLEASASWAYWGAWAWWIDPASGAEYIIAGDDVPNVGLTAIYKVKVNADGTADIAGATKIPNERNSAMDGALSLSADGKKLCGAFPWPNCAILDVATGKLTSRHAGGFGCQANLAPDNSYRFFHCEGDHLGVMMFGTNLSDPTNWYVNLAVNLVGVPSGGMDFMAPRWTNHVQYYTAQCPMGDNYEGYCAMECYMEDNGSLYSKSATWVQTQINMLKVSKFFLGRFSADFKSQEKSIMIGADPRYMQYGGDGWICNGTTDGSPCSATASSNAIRTGNASTARIQRTGSSLTIHTGSGASSVIRISDSRGRVVRTWSGSGTCALDAQDLSAGAYLVSVVSADRSQTARLPVVGSAR